MFVQHLFFFFFFFNDTATTEIYTLSLHDALPICLPAKRLFHRSRRQRSRDLLRDAAGAGAVSQRHLVIDLETRSEEHTSELQSQSNLVCRLLLEKKKKTQIKTQVLNKSYTPYKSS